MRRATERHAEGNPSHPRGRPAPASGTESPAGLHSGEALEARLRRIGAERYALLFKTDVLRAQLDALHSAYVAPGLPPPGAFVPDEMDDA